MPIEQQNKTSNATPIQLFASAVGIALLCTAVAVLLVILLTIFQIVRDPDSVVAVQLIRSFLSAQLPLLTAEANGMVNSIEVEPGARMLAVIFSGAMAVLALGSVFNALIRGGLALLKFGQGDGL